MKIIYNDDYHDRYFIIDNKIVYQSFGTGLYDAIYAIYGKSIVDNIIEFDFKKSDFSFSGYLGKPTYSKPNRTYQTLIINGRYVINQTISTAIYKAYENFLMKGNFPFFVIHLNIPLDKIDVNVHPNKLDVKFENNNELFGIVYQGISDILYDINNTKVISSEDENVIDSDKLIEEQDEQKRSCREIFATDGEEVFRAGLFHVAVGLCAGRHSGLSNVNFLNISIAK